MTVVPFVQEGELDRAVRRPSDLTRSLGRRPGTGRYKAGDLAPIVAATLVSLTAGAGLGRLFVSRRPIADICAVVLLTHVICTVGRRLRIPTVIAIILSAAASGFVILTTQYPETVRHHLPTRATLTFARATVAASWRQFASVRAPVPTQVGFTVSAMLAAWLIAMLADLLIFRFRLLAEGLIPSLAVVVFTAALSTPRYRFPAVGSYVVAVAALIALTRRAERRSGAPWLGRVLEKRARSAVSAGFLVAVVAAATMLIAPRIPNATGRGVVDWRATERNQGTRLALSPLVSLKSRLESLSDAEMFTVAADSAAYWRLTALENFDGAQWTSEGAVHGAGQKLSTAFPNRTGANTLLDQEFTIGALSSIWLPAAYQPIGVSDGNGGDAKDIRYDRKAGSLTTSKASAAGLRYGVRSALPVLSADILASSVPGDPGSEYRTLPDSFPARVAAQAEAVTSKYATAYQKARALQDWFRHEFVYDLKPPPPVTGDQLVEFVFATRRGYCEHFASAYAAMARSIGLPSRVAVGFTPGVLSGDGRFHVTGRQAHAWPEVFLSGAGWVAFEPTPGRGIPGAEPYTGVAAQQDVRPESTTTTSIATGSTSTVPATAPPLAVGRAPVGPSPAANGTSPLAAALMFVVLLAVVVLCGVGWRELRRRRRRSRHGSVVEAAWGETEDAVTWLGAHRRTDESVMAFAHRAADAVAIGGRPAQTSAIVDLAAHVEAGRYAPEPPLVAPDHLAQLVSSVADAVTSTLSPRRRALRKIDPRLRRGRRRTAP